MKLSPFEQSVAHLMAQYTISFDERYFLQGKEDLACNLALRCITSLNHDMPLLESLQRILDDLCGYFGAVSGFCVLFQAPHICVTWPQHGSYFPDSSIEYPSAAAIREWERLFHQKRQMVIPDVDAADTSPAIRKLWQDHHIRSIILTPFLVNGNMLGYLTLHNVSKNQDQIATLDMIISALSGAVQNASLLEQNRKLQYSDPLTGHMNFDGFKKWATQILQEYPNRKYAVWYCDIKRFKYINDDFGYSTGDHLLRHWVQVSFDNLRRNEIIGRISGDNIALLTWYEDIAELETLYTNIVSQVSGYLHQPGRRFDVEIVAGIYLLKPEDMENPDINQMLDWANVAQKSVKSLSGSRLAFFTDELWQTQLREMEISQHLQEGLRLGEFTVWFQPQYNYESGNLIGAEALVRWTHPALGRLSPAEFIPILERDGQITELDSFVWETVCRCMHRWYTTDTAVPSLAISVNISRLDIRNTDLCRKLCRLVEEYHLSPQMLRLEITESAYMEEPEQLIAVVRDLREHGFTVEMDDFGSGFSSLNILKDVPVDILKLDMRFLGDSDNSFRSGNILSSVVRMAHWLELPVIAEGVETRTQADYLKSLGCYLMQGYYFARPMPEDDFLKLLRESTPEHIEKRYESLSLLNMREFLDTKSDSSFLFNSCIGGAGILEYNGDSLEGLILNDAFFETIEWSRTEFETFRTHMIDTILQEDHAQLRITLRDAVAMGSASCEVRTDSGKNWLHMRYRLLSSSADSHILFVLLENVTWKHELQSELDEVTTELRSYLDLMPGGVFRYEADGEGQFGYISQGLPEMLGYTEAQLRRKFNNRFEEMVYTEDRERVLSEINAQIAVSDCDFCEYRIETADGNLKWVYDAGRLVTDAHGKRWFYVIVTDIDAQKQNESSIQ